MKNTSLIVLSFLNLGMCLCWYVTMAFSETKMWEIPTLTSVLVAILLALSSGLLGFYAIYASVKGKISVPVSALVFLISIVPGLFFVFTVWVLLTL